MSHFALSFKAQPLLYYNVFLSNWRLNPEPHVYEANVPQLSSFSVHLFCTVGVKYLLAVAIEVKGINTRQCK